MSIKLYRPESFLSNYIKCIWKLEDRTKEECSVRLIPTGCIELYFYLGDPGLYKNKNKVLIRSMISGQKTVYRDIISRGEVNIICVLFKPETINRILEQPVHYINDDIACAPDIFGREIEVICEKLYYEDDFNMQVKIIGDFIYKKHIQSSIETDLRIIEGINQLTKTGGLLSIDKLSEHLNISRRQLERKFISAAGLAPKKLGRIIRFQKALFIKQNDENISLTDLAYLAGYSDQPHFINDFKLFTGIAPGEYFRQDHAFSDYYTFT